MRALVLAALALVLTPPALAEATSWSTTRSFGLSPDVYAAYAFDEFRVSGGVEVAAVLTWTGLAQLEMLQPDSVTVGIGCDDDDPALCHAGLTGPGCEERGEAGVRPTDGGRVEGSFWAAPHHVDANLSGTLIQVRAPFTEPDVVYTLTLTAVTPFAIESDRASGRVDPIVACRLLGE